MRTVVLGDQPRELADLIERRRATGADLYDEVWEGDYHMTPAPSLRHAHLDDELATVLRPLATARGLHGSGPFNLGVQDDYRVPDRGLHHQIGEGSWTDSAALVVEILSPFDESWEKLPFYARHEVDEVVMVDLETSSLTWLARRGDNYEEVTSSELLGVEVAEVAAAIDWPAPS